MPVTDDIQEQIAQGQRDLIRLYLRQAIDLAEGHHTLAAVAHWQSARQIQRHDLPAYWRSRVWRDFREARARIRELLGPVPGLD